MSRRGFRGWLVSVIVCGAVVGLTVSALAQQGHPLTGTWVGDWGPDTIHRTQITLVMNWDGKSVSGVLNPGPDAVPLKSVFLDVTNWNVRIEADAKDKSGAAVHISAEGRMDDIGSYHRSIGGTWRQGSASGNFKIVRD